MESKELYRHLLGINEPWTVERVDLDMTQGRVDVYVVHTKGVRFAALNAGRNMLFMTILPSVFGVTWTVASL
jgi:hypothetical protein